MLNLTTRLQGSGFAWLRISGDGISHMALWNVDFLKIEVLRSQMSSFDIESQAPECQRQ